MTQQELDRLKVAAEIMGRWAVYLLSETEYWTPEALEQLTEEKLQEFQTRQAQSDGERKELLGQRSSRSTSRGNHGDGEAERPMPERGQRIGDRDDANGRNAIARATDESQRTSRPAAGTSEQLVHGEARRGGRGRNVASAKQPEPKFKRNYLYPENSSEIDNMTPQQRLRSNVEALEVVRTLMKEGREATADEREILGRYRGWGGVELGRAILPT